MRRSTVARPDDVEVGIGTDAASAKRVATVVNHKETMLRLESVFSISTQRRGLWGRLQTSQSMSCM